MTKNLEKAKKWFNLDLIQWIHLWIENPSEFIEETKWIHWGIWVNLLWNPSEFIAESKWIYCGIQVNLLRNPREFTEES